MNQFKAWARCRHGAMAEALSALFAASSAAAFQVLPKVSDVDRRISSLGSNPVLDYVGHWFVGKAIPHHEIPGARVHHPGGRRVPSRQGIGIRLRHHRCGPGAPHPPVRSPLAGRSGVPAQRQVFGPGDYLLYRSHYGDLQFMHAMGAYDGETAGETVDRMKMWA